MSGWRCEEPHFQCTEKLKAIKPGLNIDSFCVYDQDICWQLAAILEAEHESGIHSIDNVDYENVL